MQPHRIHVLQHGLEDRHESWCSPDGAVVLLRERGQKRWRAVVDLVVVTDAERLNGPLAFQARPGEEPDPTMRAGSAAELAQRLARQERLHLVFDAPPERS